MLNYSDEMSRSDLNSTFNSTYVLRTEGDRSIPTYILEFPSRTTAIVEDLGSSGRTIEVDVHTLDFSMPDLGNIVYRGQVLYVSRIARRQWRRGLRLDSNLSVVSMRADGSVTRTDLERGMVRSLLLPPPQHDRVLDRDFARAGRWLFFRGIPVGTVCRGNLVESPLNHKPTLPEGYSYVNP